MRVFADNCISTVNVPTQLGNVYSFDYNIVLNLYATVSTDDGLTVWDPLSGEVVTTFEEVGENFRDTLFLPGNRVGLSSSECHHGGCILIYTLGKDNSVAETFEVDNLPMTYPGAIALSPQKNLLVTEPFSPGWGVHEIAIDWNDLKVLKCREVFPGDEDDETGIDMISCSQDFQVSVSNYEESSLSSAKVSFNSEGEVELKQQETISYYLLDGEEKQISAVRGFVHDEEHLIIANEDEIVLLESVTEGSNAHLIASDVKPSGQIRINSEGQLMICEDKVIKIFEYKCNPRALQDLCRHNIRNTIYTDYSDKVTSLAIPCTLKDFLLYK